MHIRRVKKILGAILEEVNRPLSKEILSVDEFLFFLNSILVTQFNPTHCRKWHLALLNQNFPG